MTSPTSCCFVLIVFYGSRLGGADGLGAGGGRARPRLLKARETKYYDVVAALPLILWFAYGALQIRPILVNDTRLMGSGAATLFTYVQFVSLALVTLFDLLLIYLLVVRDRPVAKSKGVLPRAFGFIGTFFGVSILQLPVAHLASARRSLRRCWWGWAAWVRLLCCGGWARASRSCRRRAAW